MNCPNCDREIANSTYCGCGWKRKNTQEPLPLRITCAQMGCERHAILRIKVMPDAWSNFCVRHYLAWHQARADNVCATLGLTTIEQKRQWLEAYLQAAVAKMQASTTPATREPGEE